MNQIKKKILVIEDELHIAEGIKLNLSLQGHDVKVEGDGIRGLDTWRKWSPDLLVLDLMLPGLDGHKIIKAIREENLQAPILVLSAKDQTRDKVRCLEDGVDDYIAKPFDLDEFLLRVKRLLQQSDWYDHRKGQSDLEVNESLVEFQFGDNQVNLKTLEAISAKNQFKLTAQEAQILKLFFSNEGRPLSRKELLLFGWDYDADTSTRTVDNFIVRLRRYFEKDPKNPRHFISMRSVGYVFKKG